jgi:UDP-glucose 4-epimerase
MRVMVTGGNGFIGRNLVAHLSERHEVLAPGRAELDLSDAVAVDSWFARNRVDVVVHGAVRPGHRNAADPSRQLWMNLRMFHGLARNADAFGRLILLSSGAVYDITRPNDLVREDELGASLPSDEHGLSKYAIAQHLELAGRAGAIDAVELRLFGVFGPHEDYAIRFISNAICKALFGLPITLRQDRVFSYLDVADLGPIVEAFLGGPHGHVAYNVTPDAADHLVALAERVRERAGGQVPIEVATPGLGLPYSGSNARLRSELQQARFTPIDVSIDRLYRWYEANRAAISPAALLVDR